MDSLTSDQKKKIVIGIGICSGVLVVIISIVVAGIATNWFNPTLQTTSSSNDEALDAENEEATSDEVEEEEEDIPSSFVCTITDEDNNIKNNNYNGNYVLIEPTFADVSYQWSNIDTSSDTVDYYLVKSPSEGFVFYSTEGRAVSTTTSTDDPNPLNYTGEWIHVADSSPRIVSLLSFDSITIYNIVDSTGTEQNTSYYTTYTEKLSSVLDSFLETLADTINNNLEIEISVENILYLYGNATTQRYIVEFLYNEEYYTYVCRYTTSGFKPNYFYAISSSSLGSMPDTLTMTWVTSSSSTDQIISLSYD